MTISLNANSRTAPKDEVLFKEGQEPSKIFLIKDGTVLCLKKSKDRLIPVFLAGPQQIVGEEAVLSKRPYNYTAVVMESSEIIEVNAATIGDTLEQAPYWLGALMATLGERLVGTADAIAEHRIVSSELAGDAEFTAQEENRLKKLIDERGFCKGDFSDIETSLPKAVTGNPELQHIKNTINK